ncbi:MAG TPA: adenosylcobinamide-GDP ribazoletransferase [Nitrospirota bacterium]|nr:adenosylcobinamide-GDP ribazoletransferase [Nitrospirota bacterium]
MIKNFINAVEFLTIFTISRKHDVTEGDLAKSVVYFPFVGFLIGVILNYSDKALAWTVPPTIANALLLIMLVLITRAIHIDGLADTLDGIMGGHDRTSRLEIMKDSRLGTAGALGIVLLLLVKYLCFNNLFDNDKASALLTAPMLGRWSQILMVFRANYGREQGMGSAFVGHLRVSGMISASAVALGLAVFVSGIWAAILISSVALFTIVCRWYLVRKLGGVTGDAIGAVSELNEALTLLLFVILSNRS